MITFKENSGIVTSDQSTLRFGFNTMFFLDNHANAEIPDATWAKDSIDSKMLRPIGIASTIRITGNTGGLKHAGTPAYGNFIVDLPLLTDDASLAFPDGTKISNLKILNTNNYTLTLLNSTSPSSFVNVVVGRDPYGYVLGGNLTISGNTKVTIAKATGFAPETSYKL